MIGTLRIVIADDHPLVRRGLAEALTEVVDATVDIVEVGSVDGAASALTAGGADLLLLDLQMPGMNGLAGLQRLRARHPSVPVLVVSATEDPTVMHEAVAAGASGFLPKSSPIGAIGEAVNAIIAGDIWLPDAVAGESASVAIDTPDLGLDLTPQQHRVLALLSDGKPNKQIAFELAVTEATVKAHLSQIFRKLGVHSRTQAVLSARRLIPPRPPTG
jgi:DNA-binding NarL/FixJ family response regulator